MKHEIEIPDLPEGWDAVAYRGPKEGESYWCDIGIITAICDIETFFIIVRKKQPRRIDNIESYDPSSPNGFD